MSEQIRTFSGDLYEVPAGQEDEIEDYRQAVQVIKRIRENQYRDPLDQYNVALKTMMQYEEGRTGWQYIDGK